MDDSVAERAVALLRRRWRWLAAFAVLGLLWGLAGFLLVPHLARGAIEDAVRGVPGHRVDIGRIAFNPFTLTAEVRDLALAGPEGTPLASFARLRVNAELFSSLLHRAWTLAELRLERPVLNVQIDAQGRLNLAALVPRSPPGAPPPAPAGERSLPAVRIGQLSVDEGSLGYQDRSRARPFAASLTPIHFRLNDFRTTPAYRNAYHFEAETLAGEHLSWSGGFSLQPLGSDGEFSVSALKVATLAAYLHDALPLELPSGQIGVAGRYRLRLDGTVGLDVELPKVTLRELAIAPRGAGAAADPWIRLPAVDLTGATLSLAARRVRVESLRIADAGVTLWRDAAGINLARLLTDPGPAAAPASAPGQPATAVQPSWDLRVGRIEIAAARVDFEDRVLEPAARVQFAPIDATLTGYALGPGTPLQVEASVAVGRGRLSARGALTPAPLAAELEVGVEAFELPPLQPWVASATALSVERGSVSARGRIALRPAPQRGQSGLEFRGDVAIAQLLTRDAALRQELVGWQRLELKGIDWRQRPDRLVIDTIRARQPYGRVIIAADRSLNITRALAGPLGTAAVAVANDGTQRRAVAAAPATAMAAAPALPRARSPMRIRRVLIEEGRADFADHSVQPNFAAGIVGLSGSVTDLSSDPDSRASVALTGSVDRYAPVDIRGEVNLLAADVFSDLALSFRNMELTTFNPYSGKFAGYNIAKGKLTTELKYHVEKRRLEAQHHIVLDQLEFGAATESKDAVPLPVRLAVALLKDRDGVIDIDLPVSGSLDDPEFRIGPIVWKAVLSLVRKIVTAPFALLGSLFGGGADLQYVPFAAGSAGLAPAEQEKLGQLARALTERPQLRLDIPLQTLAAADDAALAEAAFESALAAVPPGTGKPPANPRLAALTALYVQGMGAKPAFPAPGTGGEVPSPDPAAEQLAWLETQLRPKYVATPEQRAALARARADAVQQAVLAGGQVPPERVFLAERASGAGGEADAVRMELKLE